MASLLAVVTYTSLLYVFPPPTILYTGLETVGQNIKKQGITEMMLKVRFPKFNLILCLCRGGYLLLPYNE
jgi:hypothetical protein